MEVLGNKYCIDDLILKIHQLYDAAELPAIIAPFCSLLKITRLEYVATIPVNKIKKTEERKEYLLFDSGANVDETHCITKTYLNKQLNAQGSVHICWERTFTPDDEQMRKMLTLSAALYLFFSRKYLNDSLVNIVNYDLLTELPSLEYAEKLYDSAVPAHRKGNLYAVIFANIQNMKYFNKMFGSDIGDQILQVYATTLSNLCDKDEYITRPGGDNFLLAVKKERLDYILDKLADIEIAGLQGLGSKVLHLSAWCGISRDAPGTLPFSARVHQASVATQQAKTSYHTRVVYYSEETENKTMWAKKVISGFLDSVKNEEFLPFYQPKVHIPTGNIIGMEALVRWKKDGNFIPPGMFVPILEQDDMISELDLYILDKACRDIRKWLEAGLRVPRVSVNLSRKNLYDDNIIEKIIQILSLYDTPIECIEIEITETSTLEEFKRLTDLAMQLHDNGIKVSIDDFGTGYSSLSMLKNVCADIVKIDKTFVDDCIKERRSYILIKNIISLASELEMEIISEGVETLEQAEFLLGVGCKNAQGYLYSKPIPYEEMAALLAEGRIIRH